MKTVYEGKKESLCVCVVLPSVQCAASESEQFAWHQQHGWGCDKGFCVCCNHFPELQQTGLEPELESEDSTTDTQATITVGTMCIKLCTLYDIQAVSRL